MKCPECNSPTFGYHPVLCEWGNQLHVGWLRFAGCQCDTPHVWFRPGIGPQCLQCNRVYDARLP